jgi:hypothetical protein
MEWALSEQSGHYPAFGECPEVTLAVKTQKLEARRE